MSKSASPWVVNTTQASFAIDVIERSKQTPVVVDFWAEWCQPCRMLGPLLESLADEYGGRFVLVKAETDQVPDAMAQFNVESIPAVYAVIDGEIADYFVGALSAEQARAWLDRVFLVVDVVNAQRLEATDPAAAEVAYRTLGEKLPNEAALQIGLARTLLAQNRDADAAAIIQQLERRGFLEEEAEKVKASLELRAQKTPGVETCRRAAAEQPANLRLQLQLGEALAADQQYQEALDVLLDVVGRDRADCRERARQLMVDIFRVQPPDSELVRIYRRKLSSALY